MNLYFTRIEPTSTYPTYAYSKQPGISMCFVNQTEKVPTNFLIGHRLLKTLWATASQHHFIFHNGLWRCMIEMLTLEQSWPCQACLRRTHERLQLEGCGTRCWALTRGGNSTPRRIFLGTPHLLGQHNSDQQGRFMTCIFQCHNKFRIWFDIDIDSFME